MKLLLAILSVTVMAGCAHAPKSASTSQIQDPVPAISDNRVISDTVSSTTPSASEDTLIDQKGGVFGKTIFAGVLETNYVRLIISEVNNPEERYEFYVGSKANKSALPWEGGKTVEPGYFFLQFPPGAYHITSLSIPVGSTLATEHVNLMFTVDPDHITYLGTLLVNGTKERIRFGGVPVVQPGFDYEIAIANELGEAEIILQRNYPNNTYPLRVDLFRNLPVNRSLSPKM